MKFTAFNCTCVGAGHAKKGKICQDASASVNGDGFAVAAVSDGHGGEEYFRSDVGAAFAVAAAKELAEDFARNVSRGDMAADHGPLLTGLANHIAADWNGRVERHRKENPFTDGEINALPARARDFFLSGANGKYAYGATLLLAAATESYWFGLHIGDGKCVTETEKGFEQPIPWDEKCFLNVTTSMCDADAQDEFRYCYGEEIPPVIFIATDGIDNCFSGDGQLYGFYGALLSLFGQRGFDGAVRELSDYLPRMSAAGSGDDMSVAALLDMEAVQRSHMEGERTE